MAVPVTMAVTMAMTVTVTVTVTVAVARHYRDFEISNIENW